MTNIACIRRRIGKHETWVKAAVIASLSLAIPSGALATPILQESLINLNGTLYHNTFAVPGLNSAGFDASTGLGTLQLTLSPGAAGGYFVDTFFDHQVATPFYNEFGAVSGAPAAGQSYQVDEPEFGDANRIGTIFTHTSNNALDNTNYIPGTTSNFFNACGANGGGAVDPSCNNDVSMAMGFNFILAANEEAVITLLVTPNRPTAGFYLSQTNPGDAANPSATIFFSGNLLIQQTEQPPVGPEVPEPATVLLFGTGLGALARRRLRRKARAGAVDDASRL